MTEKRYIYADVGIRYEILDSWFGYTGDDEPTEREIEEYDYLVIGLASNQDAAEGICRRLNDQQDEINHLSNFGLHVILDKKNKEIEQLKQQLKSIEDDFKFSCSENYTEFNKDKLYVKDTHTKIHLHNRNLFIEVYIPQIDEFYRFKYTITGKSLMRKFIENYNPNGDVE